MQDPDHQKSKCAKCKAPRGAPCRNTDGSISEHVHHGRPYWSAMVDRKLMKFKGARVASTAPTDTDEAQPVFEEGDLELELELLDFSVVLDLVGQRSRSDDGRAVLFGGTDICADCGDPYAGVGLLTRCQERHDVQPPPRPKYRWRRK